jgi:hypothetical protein
VEQPIIFYIDFYTPLSPPTNEMYKGGEKKGGQKISIAALESALLIHTKWGGLKKAEG